LGAGRRFAHYFEVIRVFERALDAFDDQPMIVGDKDPHGSIVVKPSDAAGPISL
jgi:hypothetical protein